jgi:hypothetical protein
MNIAAAFRFLVSEWRLPPLLVGGGLAGYLTAIPDETKNGLK